MAKRTLDGREELVSTMGFAPSPAEGASHEHEYSYRGRADAPGDVWCEHPSVLRCRCGDVKLARCAATRDDSCRPCAEVHRRDIAAVLRSGAAGDRPEGFFFVTITAPGADVLPWDRSMCGHGVGECSGPLGCRVGRVDAARWNASAPQRWSWFVTALRRELGVDVQFGGSWEGQDRGVLHRHSLMRALVSRGAMERAVRDCARRYGFGSQVDVQAVTASCAQEVARRAGYCASYATKGSAICEVVRPATGEVVRGGYRRWSASRRWGASMRRVRCKRQGFAMAKASGASGDALDLYADFYAEVVYLFPGSVIVPPAAAAAVAM